MGDYPVALGANVVWVLVIAGWTLGMMIPFFYLLKICGLLRITPHEEEVRPFWIPPNQSKQFTAMLPGYYYVAQIVNRLSEWHIVHSISC